MNISGKFETFARMLSVSIKSSKFLDLKAGELIDKIISVVINQRHVTPIALLVMGFSSLHIPPRIVGDSFLLYADECIEEIKSSSLSTSSNISISTFVDTAFSDDKKIKDLLMKLNKYRETDAASFPIMKEITKLIVIDFLK